MGFENRGRQNPHIMETKQSKSQNRGIHLQSKLPRLPGNLPLPERQKDLPKRTVERSPIQRSPGDETARRNGIQLHRRPKPSLLHVQHLQHQHLLPIDRHRQRSVTEADVDTVDERMEHVLVRAEGPVRQLQRVWAVRRLRFELVPCL